MAVGGMDAPEFAHECRRVIRGWTCLKLGGIFVFTCNRQIAPLTDT